MITSTEARRRDERDPLPAYLRAFSTDGLIHLNGNSLGPPYAGLIDRLDNLVEGEWSRLQVRGWFREGWLDLPRTIGDKIAMLLGAAPGQVVVAGETTSTTLFNALAAACRLRPARSALLIEATSFPTDLYVAESVAHLLGRDLLVESGDDFDEAVGTQGARCAAVVAAPVDFRSGRRREIGPTTKRCHDAGAVSVWDLSHATGVLPVELDTHEVDLAIGCGYKYLGGGPGAPAFLYIAHRLQATVDFPLRGWHGHANPFAMSSRFEAAKGIDRGRTGTPPVLSLAALDHALDPLIEVGTSVLHRRSQDLAEFFLECLADASPELRNALVSPEEAGRRGGHVALHIPRSEAVEDALLERGVLVDSRPPDLIRVAFAPLYITYEQVWRAVNELCRAVRTVP